MKKTLATIFVGALAVGGVALLDSKEAPAIPLEPTIAQKLAQEESIFAHLDANDIVDSVIVISQENIDTGKWGNPDDWVRTSSNGIIRKNYAGIGYQFDRTRDAFIPPKKVDDDTFDESRAIWTNGKKIICINTATTTCK